MPGRPKRGYWRTQETDTQSVVEVEKVDRDNVEEEEVKTDDE